MTPSEFNNRHFGHSSVKGQIVSALSNHSYATRKKIAAMVNGVVLAGMASKSRGRAVAEASEVNAGLDALVKAKQLTPQDRAKLDNVLKRPLSN
jgi:hypothetical protein